MAHLHFVDYPSKKKVLLFFYFIFYLNKKKFLKKVLWMLLDHLIFFSFFKYNVLCVCVRVRKREIVCNS